MLELPPSALQWLGAGGLLVIAGALIRFRGWTFLLAGYDESAAVPDEVVADIAGNTVLRIGLAAVALGGLLAFTRVPSYLPPLFGAVVVLAVLRLIYRLNTYTPTDTA
jgi:cytochrome c biogenesis protein CcdA